MINVTAKGITYKPVILSQKGFDSKVDTKELLSRRKTKAMDVVAAKKKESERTMEAN